MDTHINHLNESHSFSQKKMKEAAYDVIKHCGFTI